MSSPNQATDYNSQLTDLARQFEELAHQVGVTVQSGSTPGGDPGNLRAKLLERHAKGELRAWYRGLVKLAGELLLTINRDGLIQVDGLSELVAAHDMREWGELVVEPSNLFALLVGGPRIELRDRNGNIGEYEKLNQGWPIQYRLASPRSEWEQVMVKHFGDTFPPDGGQCLRYAKFCRSLIGAGLADRSASSILNKPLLWTEPVQPLQIAGGIDTTQIGSSGVEDGTRPHQDSEQTVSSASAKISPCVQRAHEQYKYVLQIDEDSSRTDDEAYQILKNAYDERPEEMTERFGGALNDLETWKRYLRASLREKKHTSRAERHVGCHSIVPEAEI